MILKFYIWLFNPWSWYHALKFHWVCGRMSNSKKFWTWPMTEVMSYKPMETANSFKLKTSRFLFSNYKNNYLLILLDSQFNMGDGWRIEFYQEFTSHSIEITNCYGHSRSIFLTFSNSQAMKQTSFHDRLFYWKSRASSNRLWCTALNSYLRDLRISFWTHRS